MHIFLSNTRLSDKFQIGDILDNRYIENDKLFWKLFRKATHKAEQNKEKLKQYLGEK